MKKTILYGIGDYYKNNRHMLPDDIDVIAYGDSSKDKATSCTGALLNGKPVLLPEEIEKTEFDLLYICTDYYFGYTIYQHLIMFNIPAGKIRFLNRINAVKGGWKYTVQEDGSILSTLGKVKIRERERTDFDIAAEVFAFNNYNINIPEKGTIVIDMGMNVGIAALYFAAEEKVEKVYGFEPFPDTYQQALDNISLNDKTISSKIFPSCCAVSDWEGDKEVPVNAEQTGWRSILSQDENKRKIIIHCRRAEDVVGEIIRDNPGKKIFLKVDTEGSEFQIFASMEKAGLLKEIDTVMLEYHGAPDPILDALEKNSFRYVRNGRAAIGMVYAFQTGRV